MQLTQSKTIEIFFTGAITLALLLSALHAKDITPQFTNVKIQKIVKDDSQNSLLRKIVSDWHNHIDKFSMKSPRISGHILGADSRSLKKHSFSTKQLQKLLD